MKDLAPYFGEQKVRTDVSDSVARVKNKPMVHVKNNPKVGLCDNSVDENSAKELCESSSETIDENNVILPRRPFNTCTETSRKIFGRALCVSNLLA